MAEKKKKMNKGIIACICVAVVAVIAAIVAVIVINVNKPNIVGKYTLTATIDSEGNESTTTVDLMKAFGASETIEFRDDKTGILEVEMGSSFMSAFSSDETDSDATNTASTKFTYDDKKLKGAEGNDFEADYEFKDGAVLVTVGDETMKFTKDQQ